MDQIDHDSVVTGRLVDEVAKETSAADWGEVQVELLSIADLAPIILKYCRGRTVEYCSLHSTFPG